MFLPVRIWIDVGVLVGAEIGIQRPCPMGPNEGGDKVMAPGIRLGDIFLVGLVSFLETLPAQPVQV